MLYWLFLPAMNEVIQMDKETLSVITHLRANARTTLTRLARASGIPVSTLFDRVRNLQDFGITRCAALLDFQKLGYGAQATIFLKVAKEKRDELKQHLLNAAPVNCLWRVNNGYDFMVECIFRDLRDFEEFSDRLERKYGVKAKEMHFVVEELKREGFLANITQAKQEVRDE